VSGALATPRPEQFNDQSGNEVVLRLNPEAVHVVVPEGVFFKTMDGALLLKGKAASGWIERVRPLLACGISRARLLALGSESTKAIVADLLDRLVAAGVLLVSSHRPPVLPEAALSPTPSGRLVLCASPAQLSLLQAAGADDTSALAPIGWENIKRLVDSGQAEDKTLLVILDASTCLPAHHRELLAAWDGVMAWGMVCADKAIAGPVRRRRRGPCPSCAVMHAYDALATAGAEQGPGGSSEAAFVLSCRWLSRRLLVATGDACGEDSARDRDALIWDGGKGTRRACTGWHPACERCRPEGNNGLAVALRLLAELSHFPATTNAMVEEDRAALVEALATERDEALSVFAGWPSGDLVQLPLCRARARVRWRGHAPVDALGSGLDHVQARLASFDAALGAALIAASPTPAWGVAFPERRLVRLSDVEMGTAARPQGWIVGREPFDLMRRAVLAGVVALLDEPRVVSPAWRPWSPSATVPVLHKYLWNTLAQLGSGCRAWVACCPWPVPTVALLMGEGPLLVRASLVLDDALQQVLLAGVAYSQALRAGECTDTALWPAQHCSVPGVHTDSTSAPLVADLPHPQALMAALADSGLRGVLVASSPARIAGTDNMAARFIATWAR
jgi:hypothetical protein